MHHDWPGGVDIGFSAKEAADICRLTPEQLAEWEIAGMANPSLPGPPGLRRRRYSYADLLALDIVRFLLEWGAPPEQVQAAVRRIRVGVTDSPADTCMTVLNGELLVFANRDEAACFVACDPRGGIYVADANQISDDLDEEIRDVCPDYFESPPGQDACRRHEAEAQAARLAEFLETVSADDFDF
ncbi:MAG: MerR family transcriptional regulator [Acidimicrobiia bacterium]|nr:MerR family transcriptional regulator [Acidimicrobiia bacterium]